MSWPAQGPDLHWPIYWSPLPPAPLVPLPLRFWAFMSGPFEQHLGHLGGACKLYNIIRIELHVAMKMLMQVV